MTEENVDMLFDPSMKKKKKKKAINLDDLDDVIPKDDVEKDDLDDVIPKDDVEKDVVSKPEKVIDDFDLEDFSNLKKKKKKKRDPKGPALDMDTVKDAIDEVAGDAEKEAEPKEDDTREYTYEELLTRVFDIMRAKNPNMVEGGKRKFVMKPPQVVRIGTKRTSFVNFTEICKILHRQPKQLLQFVLAELGTSGTVDGTNQLIIKGKFQQKHIENVLKRFIKEYVTCHTCRSPETILHKETRLFFLQCETCGSRCSVASIKSGFQAVTTKRARMKNN